MNDFLKSIAPALGTALLGPMGGIAAKFIADKIGLDEKTVDAVSNAISGQKLTADQLAGIKLAEIEFQKFCKTNNVDLEKIAAADRDSARNMQMATRSHMPAVLTVLVTAGFFGTLAALFNMPELKESAPMMIMLGQLSAAWAACIAFWLGTTSSSAVKTSLIAQAPAVK